jgi:hypothetical protein
MSTIDKMRYNEIKNNGNKIYLIIYIIIISIILFLLIKKYTMIKLWLMNEMCHIIDTSLCPKWLLSSMTHL